MVAAVILSAGASTRFGGRPKALLPAGDGTFLDHIVSTLQEFEAGPIVVVVGPHEAAIRRGVRPDVDELVRWVPNPEWARGRTGSVQIGLRAVGAPTDTLLWPVDTPFAAPSTLRRLAEVARRDDLGTWLIPMYQGRGGHPIWVKPPAIDRILELPPHVPLRALLPSLGPAVVRSSVEDPGVTLNVNTPSEYGRGVPAGPDE